MRIEHARTCRLSGRARYQNAKPRAGDAHVRDESCDSSPMSAAAIEAT